MEFAPRDTTFPIGDCHCMMCEAARAEQTKARPLNPFSASVREMFDKLNSAPVFEPEPQPEPQPEPVYTHVLVDYDEGGMMLSAYAELHTVESLVEAIKMRNDQAEDFQVFELGESILHVGK
jgi:hypothetical protein